MNEHDDLIKKCELLLYSITDKEVVIPLKDFKLYMGIKHYKEECIEKILELLDKETPMKPLKSEWDGYRLCGNCNSIIVSTNHALPNYCSNCGQKIDWRGEN